MCVEKYLLSSCQSSPIPTLAKVYIGVVGRMNQDSNQVETQTASRGGSNAEPKKHGPVAQPSEFSGGGDWITWIWKFKSLANLYKWDDKEKRIWLDCKLTGQAALTLETLDEETRNDFDATVEALTCRFEPESKRLVY